MINTSRSLSSLALSTANRFSSWAFFLESNCSFIFFSLSNSACWAANFYNNIINHIIIILLLITLLIITCSWKDLIPVTEKSLQALTKASAMGKNELLPY